MYPPFTLEERADLLARYFTAYARWRDLDFALSAVKNSGADPRVPELERLSRDLMELRDQYRGGLPFLPVSRCPFSAQVLYHSVDPYGIDGLWWDYDAPIRPVENYPPTFHSMTGALGLAEPVENAPFTCAPGPGIPYVVPEVLSSPSVRAVVSALTVGRHRGYVIAYYSEVNPLPVPRLSTWGSSQWNVLDTRGTFSWGSGIITSAQCDFDLTPWIRNEKLLWIQPGDSGLTLRNGEAGCPFLALAGTHGRQLIRNGKIQFISEPGGK
jgi:hypothetical protein